MGLGVGLWGLLNHGKGKARVPNRTGKGKGKAFLAVRRGAGSIPSCVNLFCPQVEFMKSSCICLLVVVDVVYATSTSQKCFSLCFFHVKNAFPFPFPARFGTRAFPFPRFSRPHQTATQHRALSLGIGSVAYPIFLYGSDIAWQRNFWSF